MDERDLRALMSDKAGEYPPEPLPWESVARKMKRRLFASILLPVSVMAVVGITAILVTHTGAPPPEGESPRRPVAIQLVDDYVDDHDGRVDEDLPVSREEVQRHVDCMREQGFDLPDPVRNDHGWFVEVENPEDFGFETRRWREASFVTCAPTPPPGPGDLVFGIPISRGQIEAFAGCMGSEGFDLPEPTRIKDEVGWTFELSGSNVDFGDPAWNRAVFVTCWGHTQP